MHDITNEIYTGTKKLNGNLQLMRSIVIVYRGTSTRIRPSRIENEASTFVDLIIFGQSYSIFPVISLFIRLLIVYSNG